MASGGTAFLTGGTGFVGSHVARALAARGWNVRALARDAGARRSALPSDPRIEAIAGDLSGASDLSAAISGARAIVHVAGLTRARSLAEYRAVNAAGTARVIEAGRRSAPDALFVLVSSQAAAGPMREGRPVREGDPARPVSWYGTSKLEGEEEVRTGWPGPWIVVRPSVVFGPGDRGLFVLFQAAARGFLPVPAGATRVQVIRAERAADAIARAAARRDLAGRTVFLADPEPVSTRALSEAIAELPRKRPLLVPVPRFLIRVAGASQTAVEAITGRSRPFNADKAREILAGDWVCDPGPVLGDLGVPPARPLREELAETWEWYVRQGWLTL
jgi:nucleoside-diphosphate-sugar epimerase